MPSSSKRLNSIVDEFLKRIESGEKIGVEELCREHPDLADELREFFTKASRLSRTPIGDTRITASDTSNLEVIAFQALHAQGLEIRDEIGRGGMGIVYRATRTATGQDVAVKILPPAMASNPVRMARFQQEATAASQLEGSCVVPVLEVIREPVPMIVMPLLEGGTLRKLLLRGPDAQKQESRWQELSKQDYLEKIFRVGDRILDAVVAMHRSQILHRDIKPGNILIDTHDEAWLSDFGLARLSNQDASLTSTGDQLGTRGYMSPEQIEAQEEVDHRADIFGLGVTLYEALTGALPYGRAVLDQHSPLPELPSNLEKFLPKAFDNVILKAIEPDKNRRYASAEEFQRDWQRVREGLRPKARLQSRLARRIRSLRVRGSVAITAVVGVMLASLVAGYVLFREAPIAKPGEEVIEITTLPPKARVAIYPLDPVTREPNLSLGINPLEETPLKIGLPPGDYHVTAYLEENKDIFHEVIRRVPKKSDQQGTPQAYRPLYWKRMPDGSIQWLLITLFDQSVTDSMVKLPRGSVKLEGFPDSDPRSEEFAFVHTFAIDPTEVTRKQYRQNATGKPAKQLPGDASDEAAILSYYAAWTNLELVGKRLPSAAEFQFAATNAGRNRFSWGDTFPQEQNTFGATFGPVGNVPFDFMESAPEVKGLYSNVAELLSSGPPSNPGNDSHAANTTDNFMVLIGGGDLKTAAGDPTITESSRSRSQLNAVPANLPQPGVGFRGVRSIRPRIRPADFTRYGQNATTYRPPQ